MITDKQDINYTQVLEKAPPFNIHVEHAILGSMLLEPPVCTEIFILVQAEYFYLYSHQLIFNAIKKLFLAGSPIDTITVAEELQNQEEITEAGGMIYLSQLVNYVPIHSNLDAYVKILKEKYIRRELCHFLVEMSVDVFKEEIPLQETIDKIKKKIENG